MMITYYFINRYYDKKNGFEKEVYKPQDSQETQLKAPLISALIPILPIVLLIVFSKIDEDTIPIKFTLTQDEFELRKYYLEFEKDEEEAFNLFIPAGVFTDIYGHINDTLNYTFRTRALDFYSTITMEIIGVKEKSMVQILNEKGTVLEEQVIYSDTTLLFNYLHPLKYKLALYYDSNNNDKWDTGNYGELKQAERMFYYPFFPEALEIKSNMDIVNTWELYPKIGVSNIQPIHKTETHNH